MLPVVLVVAVTGVVSALLADARTSAQRSQAFMNFLALVRTMGRREGREEEGEGEEG